ncbi:hypothetical protein Tco_0557031 [Tanacetum coccineum]
MSSPDHPTSNMEDAFSSNFLNYLPLASLDYIPTSPGKTYSSSSNSFGIVPLISPTLSLFHDDPYMKALQAFYTEKSPNSPPTIIPPSSIPKPQEFFLLEKFMMQSHMLIHFYVMKLQGPTSWIDFVGFLLMRTGRVKEFEDDFGLQIKIVTMAISDQFAPSSYATDRLVDTFSCDEGSDFF